MRAWIDDEMTSNLNKDEKRLRLGCVDSPTRPEAAGMVRRELTFSPLSPVCNISSSPPKAEAWCAFIKVMRHAKPCRIPFGIPKGFGIFTNVIPLTCLDSISRAENCRRGTCYPVRNRKGLVFRSLSPLQGLLARGHFLTCSSQKRHLREPRCARGMKK